jgi:hypothetical protein
MFCVGSSDLSFYDHFLITTRAHPVIPVCVPLGNAIWVIWIIIYRLPAEQTVIVIPRSLNQFLFGIVILLSNELGRHAGRRLFDKGW